MVRATLKHAGKRDWIGHMFNMRGPIFKIMLTRFISTICKHLHDIFVVSWRRTFNACHGLETISISTLLSRTVSYRFQASTSFSALWKSGSIQEESLYLSEKHKAYGYKVEESFLPNKVAVGCNSHRPGSMHDFAIMRDIQDFHKTQSDKLASHSAIAEYGPFRTEHTDS